MADGADYKKTILLPKTGFPMRANLAQREPEILKRWQKERIYERALEARASAPRFVFHDGPPYANGHIHYGHILNKILKDFVVKYQTMAGRLTRYVPGWDCHGLPIELGVERKLAAKGKSLDRPAVRRACRQEAEKWVKTQSKEFQRLGVFGTWDEPYLTLHPGFEQRILEGLSAFLRHDLVYRGKKPVHWCGRCKTALAEAEVEYQDHESPSIYVKFPVQGEQASGLAERLGLPVDRKPLPLHAMIWTTTPWTLPANLAIAVHPGFDYVAVDIGGELVVLAAGLAETVLKACGLSEAWRSEPVKGEVLIGIEPRHPFEDRASPIYGADYVTLEAGTGLVHTAPGHGADDYSLGQKHGLDTFAPVDEEARFTDEVRPQWRGKHVFDANPEIVRFLAEQGVLANPEGQSIEHSYPGCWRCKTPIIFRATTQWFIAIDKPMADRKDGKSLRDLALAEIDAIAGRRELGELDPESGWIPTWGRERIHGMLADRPDWCISRQRAWGVPIPAFHCDKCEQVMLDEAICTHVAKQLGQKGADAWYLEEATELAPPGLTCGNCGNGSFTKDSSILDVWFDSGSTHAAKIQYPDAGVCLPTDLYQAASD
ncbi:MAG: class I tRNA ligase family protein, partial [Myxococcales bacterium]|nr:class I tRNA ligase family protein [Myxococcales bacterium]